MLLYRTAHVLLTPLRWIFNIRIRGKERIPKTGPIILAWNHPAKADSVLAPIMIDRTIIFLGKRELVTSWTGWFVRAVGTIFVDRNSGKSKEVIDKACARLKKGYAVGIFPEGTTEGGPKLRRFRTGVARIAAQSQVPVIPIALLRKKRGSKVVWGGCVSAVGKPIPPPKNNTLSREAYQAYSDNIKAAIRELVKKHNRKGRYSHLL